jgi:hypothetical protein
LSDQSETAIRAAVKDCLARCYRGNTPLGELAAFLAELRAKDWSAEDVRKVESSVCRVLAGVVAGDIDRTDDA